MDQKQKLQKCMQDCQNIVNELQSLANQANETKLKSTLDESAHHLDMCLRECEYASKQAP
ncbi:MAG: hypothetical protein KGZ63_12300 [Clostridiales bacterium]|jgi:hypothetical protein|nr:hypothetical protein [Clostridiales bacterium]